MSTSYYVTTPIYYVNDLPHIGHIFTTVVGDAIARYRRMRGDDVYFLTGTDEHGQNIERAAAERGTDPKALADQVVERYHHLWREFGMTHDDFLRTTQQRHFRGVEEIVRRIAASDDFYVSRHEGWYCSSCEAFYTEKELGDDHLCPIHHKPAEKGSEENVFFRLSRYQDRLLDWYDRHPESVLPETRRNEVRQFVASGLRDLSVSRTTIRWGVPFPGYEGHIVYVWLDALTNYISALGFGRDGADDLYRRYWASDGTRIHLVGKDILRFHAVYWPAFLMSAGLPLPTTVWAHGWWLRDDKKMSKTTGNVVRPDALVERFGTDSLRYFLLREMVFGQDASFSDEAFIDRYNSDLANDLGNTTSRLVTLSRRAFDNRTPPVAPQARSREGADGGRLRRAAEEAVEAYHLHMGRFAFHRALEALWKLLSETNQDLVANEPWKKLKDPDARDEVAEVLWNGCEAVRIVASALLPILPEKARAVLEALGAPIPEDFDALAWGGLPSSAELPKAEPIFPRIDKQAYLDQDSKRGPSPESQSETEKDEESTMIDIDQFFATELRVGTVRTAEPVPKSNKLLQMTVDLGDEAGGERTLVAGIAKEYTPEDLVGRQVVVVANLEPAKLMGVTSNGMVLAASDEGKPVLLRPLRPVPDGTRVR